MRNDIQKSYPQYTKMALGYKYNESRTRKPNLPFFSDQPLSVNCWISRQLAKKASSSNKIYDVTIMKLNM